MRRSLLPAAFCLLAPLARSAPGAAIAAVAAPVRPPSAALSPSAAATGEQALRAKLERAYPDVTQWEIVPLPAATRGGEPPLGSDISAIVVRVGVRSAVWVGPSSGIQSSRGELRWYAVAGFGPAVVATHRLAPGAALDARDGTSAESDLVAAGCRPLDSPQALAGMRARVTVEQGEVICASHIEKQPPVTRGEEVTVRYADDFLTLSVKGVAQADGLLGRAIPVRSTESGEIFTATVSGDGEVRVHD